MHQRIYQRHNGGSLGRLWFRIIAWMVLIAFGTQTIGTDLIRVRSAYAQNTLLTPPGTLLSVSTPFSLPVLKAISIDPADPYKISFLVDAADHPEMDEDQIHLLTKYFLTFLTIPEDDLWVNLSPYEADRIVNSDLEATTVGRDMLIQDYILKQLAASMTHPDRQPGKTFWQKILSKAQKEYGIDIPADTFHKVWVVPEKAVVLEHEQAAFIAESRLKVLIEEDYLAMQESPTRPGTQWPSKPNQTGNLGTGSLGNPSSVSSEIIREFILPELEREVNEGKHFAPLRQMFHSLILAIWFKKRLKQHLLNAVYADQRKISGISIEEKHLKEKIYDQYLAAMKKGVYNYIREDYDPDSQQVIPRKYFSGGFSLASSQRWFDTALLANGLESLRTSFQTIGEDLYRYVISLRPLGISREILADAALLTGLPALLPSAVQPPAPLAVGEGVVPLAQPDISAQEIRSRDIPGKSLETPVEAQDTTSDPALLMDLTSEIFAKFNAIETALLRGYLKRNRPEQTIEGLSTIELEGLLDEIKAEKRKNVDALLRTIVEGSTAITPFESAAEESTTTTSFESVVEESTTAVASEYIQLMNEIYQLLWLGESAYVAAQIKGLDSLLGTDFWDTPAAVEYTGKLRRSFWAMVMPEDLQAIIKNSTGRKGQKSAEDLWQHLSQEQGYFTEYGRVNKEAVLNLSNAEALELPDGYSDLRENLFDLLQSRVRQEVVTFKNMEVLAETLEDLLFTVDPQVAFVSANFPFQVRYEGAAGLKKAQIIAEQRKNFAEGLDEVFGDADTVFFENMIIRIVGDLQGAEVRFDAQSGEILVASSMDDQKMLEALPRVFNQRRLHQIRRRLLKNFGEQKTLSLMKKLRVVVHSGRSIEAFVTYYNVEDHLGFDPLSKLATQLAQGRNYNNRRLTQFIEKEEAKQGKRSGDKGEPEQRTSLLGFLRAHPKAVMIPAAVLAGLFGAADPLAGDNPQGPGSQGPIDLPDSDSPTGQDEYFAAHSPTPGFGEFVTARQTYTWKDHGSWNDEDEQTVYNISTPLNSPGEVRVNRVEGVLKTPAGGIVRGFNPSQSGYQYKKGDVVLVLENNDLNQERDRIQVDLEKKRSELGRLEGLFVDGFATVEQINTVRERIFNLESQLARNQQARAIQTVRAPYDFSVDRNRIKISNNQSIDAGVEIFHFYNDEMGRVEILVSPQLTHLGRINNLTIGGVTVNSIGHTILRLAPNESNAVLSLNFSPLGKLSIGQTVRVRADISVPQRDVHGLRNITAYDSQPLALVVGIKPWVVEAPEKGRVEFFVHEGDRVTKGQLLAKVEVGPYWEEFLRYLKKYNRAQDKLNRLVRGFNGVEVFSEDQLEGLAADRDRIFADLLNLQRKIASLYITAAESGRVRYRAASAEFAKGDILLELNTGEALVGDVANVNNLALLSSDIPVTEGDPVIVETPSGQLLPGRVSRHAPNPPGQTTFGNVQAVEVSVQGAHSVGTGLLVRIKVPDTEQGKSRVQRALRALEASHSSGDRGSQGTEVLNLQVQDSSLPVLAEFAEPDLHPFLLDEFLSGEPVSLASLRHDIAGGNLTVQQLTNDYVQALLAQKLGNRKALTLQLKAIRANGGEFLFGVGLNAVIDEISGGGGFGSAYGEALPIILKLVAAPIVKKLTGETKKRKELLRILAQSALHHLDAGTHEQVRQAQEDLIEIARIQWEMTRHLETKAPLELARVTLKARREAGLANASRVERVDRELRSLEGTRLDLDAQLRILTEKLNDLRGLPPERWSGSITPDILMEAGLYPSISEERLQEMLANMTNFNPRIREAAAALEALALSLRLAKRAELLPKLSFSGLYSSEPPDFAASPIPSDEISTGKLDQGPNVSATAEITVFDTGRKPARGIREAKLENGRHMVRQVRNAEELAFRRLHRTINSLSQQIVLAKQSYESAYRLWWAKSHRGDLFSAEELLDDLKTVRETGLHLDSLRARYLRADAELRELGALRPGESLVQLSNDDPIVVPASPEDLPRERRKFLGPLLVVPSGPNEVVEEPLPKSPRGSLAPGRLEYRMEGGLGPAEKRRIWDNTHVWNRGQEGLGAEIVPALNRGSGDGDIRRAVLYLDENGGPDWERTLAGRSDSGGQTGFRLTSDNHGTSQKSELGRLLEKSRKSFDDSLGRLAQNILSSGLYAYPFDEDLKSLLAPHQNHDQFYDWIRYIVLKSSDQQVRERLLLYMINQETDVRFFIWLADSAFQYGDSSLANLVFQSLTSIFVNRPERLRGLSEDNFNISFNERKTSSPNNISVDTVRKVFLTYMLWDLRYPRIKIRLLREYWGIDQLREIYFKLQNYPGLKRLFYLELLRGRAEKSIKEFAREGKPYQEIIVINWLHPEIDVFYKFMFEQLESINREFLAISPQWMYLETLLPDAILSRAREGVEGYLDSYTGDTDALSLYPVPSAEWEEPFLTHFRDLPPDYQDKHTNQTTSLTELARIFEFNPDGGALRRLMADPDPRARVLVWAVYLHSDDPEVLRNVEQQNWVDHLKADIPDLRDPVSLDIVRRALRKMHDNLVRETSDQDSYAWLLDMVFDTYLYPEFHLADGMGTVAKSRFSEAAAEGAAIVEQLVQRGVLEEVSPKTVRLRQDENDQPIERPTEMSGSDFDAIWTALQQPLSRREQIMGYMKMSARDLASLFLQYLPDYDTNLLWWKHTPFYNADEATQLDGIRSELDELRSPAAVEEYLQRLEIKPNGRFRPVLNDLEEYTDLLLKWMEKNKQDIPSVPQSRMIFYAVLASMIFFILGTMVWANKPVRLPKDPSGEDLDRIEGDLAAEFFGKSPYDPQSDSALLTPIMEGLPIPKIPEEVANQYHPLFERWRSNLSRLQIDDLPPKEVLRTVNNILNIIFDLFILTKYELAVMWNKSNIHHNKLGEYYQVLKLLTLYGIRTMAFLETFVNLKKEQQFFNESQLKRLNIDIDALMTKMLHTLIYMMILQARGADNLDKAVSYRISKIHRTLKIIFHWAKGHIGINTLEDASRKIIRKMLPKLLETGNALIPYLYPDPNDPDWGAFTEEELLEWVSSEELNELIAKNILERTSSGKVRLPRIDNDRAPVRPTEMADSRFDEIWQILEQPGQYHLMIQETESLLDRVVEGALTFAPKGMASASRGHKFRSNWTRVFLVVAAYLIVRNTMLNPGAISLLGLVITLLSLRLHWGAQLAARKMEWSYKAKFLLERRYAKLKEALGQTAVGTTPQEFDPNLKQRSFDLEVQRRQALVEQELKREEPTVHMVLIIPERPEDEEYLKKYLARRIGTLIRSDIRAEVLPRKIYEGGSGNALSEAWDYIQEQLEERRREGLQRVLPIFHGSHKTQKYDSLDLAIVNGYELALRSEGAHPKAEERLPEDSEWPLVELINIYSRDGFVGEMLFSEKADLQMFATRVDERVLSRRSLAITEEARDGHRRTIEIREKLNASDIRKELRREQGIRRGQTYFFRDEFNLDNRRIAQYPALLGFQKWGPRMVKLFMRVESELKKDPRTRGAYRYRHIVRDMVSVVFLKTKDELYGYLKKRLRWSDVREAYSDYPYREVELLFENLYLLIFNIRNEEFPDLHDDVFLVHPLSSELFILEEPGEADRLNTLLAGRRFYIAPDQQTGLPSFSSSDDPDRAMVVSPDSVEVAPAVLSFLDNQDGVVPPASVVEKPEGNGDQNNSNAPNRNGIRTFAIPGVERVENSDLVPPPGGLDLSMMEDQIQFQKMDNPMRESSTPNLQGVSQHLQSFRGFEFELLQYQPVLNPMDFFVQ